MSKLNSSLPRSSVTGRRSSVVKLPVILCLDVEPDPRELDTTDPGNWDGFESAFEFFNDLRPRLAAATGSPAKFNWFLRMDPQIEHVYGSASWVVQRYPNLIETLEHAGDEIGLHTHAWRWDEFTGTWVVDHGDQKWVEHCVRTSFLAYHESLGHPCRTFRFGDRWMNNEIMHLLESLGVEFDLTIEPGIRDKNQVNKDEQVTGLLPDYVTAPRQPFQPSRKDFRRNGDGNPLNLWSIPLSTGERLIIKKGTLGPIRRAVSRLRWRHQPLTLNLAITNAEFKAILNHLLADARTTYLAPVVRTDAAWNPALKLKLKQNMETLVSGAALARFVFVKPGEAMELLNFHQALPTRERISTAAAAGIN